MAEFDDTIWCDSCGVELSGPPVLTGKGYFCCLDCSQGLECSCRGWAEQDEDRRGGGQAGMVSDGGLS